MTERYNDDKISADFRHLRETECKTAPAFEQLLRPQSSNNQRPRSKVSAGFALAASAALIIVVILMNPNRDGAISDSAIDSAHYPDDGQLDIAYEMPTDFLLDTPWFLLAGSTPQFQLSTPTYEFLEETSDEL